MKNFKIFSFMLVFIKLWWFLFNFEYFDFFYQSYRICGSSTLLLFICAFCLRGVSNRKYRVGQKTSHCLKSCYGNTVSANHLVESNLYRD